MAMDVFEVLSKKIEEKRQMILTALALGSANDFAEYKDLCGRLRGLADAQMEINDLSRTLKEQDED